MSKSRKTGFWAVLGKNSKKLFEVRGKDENSTLEELFGTANDKFGLDVKRVEKHGKKRRIKDYF